MVDESWGQKHMCGACFARFYDMGRRPIVCPSCGAGIETWGEGAARRPASAGLSAVSAISVAAEDAGDVADAQIPDPLATDDDEIETVSLDDGEELDDSDQDEDGADDDDGIDGGDEFELEDGKDPDGEDDADGGDEDSDEDDLDEEEDDLEEE